MRILGFTRLLGLIWLAGAIGGAMGSRADAPLPLADELYRLAVNPITNRIYATGTSLLDSAPTLFEVDGANQSVRSIPAGFTYSDQLAIDPIQNRIYYAVPAGIAVVDGRTLAVQTVPVAPMVEIALDPIAGFVWIQQVGTVTRIDSATLATQSVSTGLTTGRFSAGKLALDPVAHRVYAAGGGPNLVEIDETTLATRTLVTTTTFGFAALAVDPLGRKLYAMGFETLFGLPMSHLWVIDVDSFTIETDFLFLYANGDETRVDDLGADPVHGRLWARVYAIYGGCGLGQLLALDTLALETTPFAKVPGTEMIHFNDGCNVWSWAMNPATNRVYGYDGDESFASWDIRVLDADVPAVTTPLRIVPVPPYFPTTTQVAVNVATNRVYATGGSFLDQSLPHALFTFDEPESALVPITTTITSDAPGPTGDVVVHFDAVSSFAPNALPIAQIYYQVDAIDGEWLAASPSGASATATLSGLPRGTHVVHAFAVDAQVATLADVNLRSPIVGAIASQEITIPAHPGLHCDVEMSQPSYQNGDAVVIASLRFTNAEPAPIPTRLRLQLRLPPPLDLVVDPIDLGANGAFAIPANFDNQLGPVTMFTLIPSTPLRGDFEWRCAFEDPSTGAVMVEDRAGFALQ